MKFIHRLSLLTLFSALACAVANPTSIPTESQTDDTSSALLGREITEYLGFKDGMLRGFTGKKGAERNAWMKALPDQKWGDIWPIPNSGLNNSFILTPRSLRDNTTDIRFDKIVKWSPVDRKSHKTNSNTMVNDCWVIAESSEKTMTIGLGTDMECRLFWASDCNYGPSDGSPVKSDFGAYPEVTRPFGLPGISTFDNEIWNAMGFQSKRAKGKLPNSISCTPKSKIMLIEV